MDTADTPDAPDAAPVSVDTADKYEQGDHVTAPAPGGGRTHAVVMDDDKVTGIPDTHVPVWVVTSGSDGPDDDTMAHFHPSDLQRQ